ncbi:MAG TPA: TonB-dependent receptor, partial [Woeseiaceae bacterium]|nr:TonB-dependent receptor [Woeseiaceae bacterium]
MNQVGPGEDVESIVVTGSRIRRAETETAAPIVTIDDEALTDRGYVSAASALNQVTSNVPALNLSPADGSASGPGQQFPNLFGLGPGRTLTLVNGRRFVTSSSGLGDSQVDANVIPVGLIDRVEIVQAGGAVVYGSDAIAGVVNYILQDDFEGLELDAQGGRSSFDDYPVYSLRGTGGRNFAEGRGNVAVNVEWSKSDPLAFADRPRSNLSRITSSNPADTGPDDGISSVREVLDARFWEFNDDGVIFTIPAPVPLPPCGFQLCFARGSDGQPLQFTRSGGITSFDPGDIAGIPFAGGGDGFRFADLSSLLTGVERTTGNLIGHYDLSDDLTLSVELLYARTEGIESPQIQARTILNPPESNAGPIVFTINNPFLSDEAIDALTAASPSFAFGAPLFLSKSFDDLLIDGRQKTTTDTWRVLLALDGELDLGGRDYYWSVSGSYGHVDGSVRAWDVWNAHYDNAINAALDGSGNIVCAINADADPANDDPACAPINPFGDDNISDAAREYVNVTSGSNYENRQADLLATFGGDVVEIPAGAVSFATAYEHRDERADFEPLAANREGLIGTGSPVLPQSGRFHTDELSVELLVPLLGKDVTLPLVEALELSGAWRYVDNSLAGTESLWSAGLQWTVTEGVQLRASRSRNFRAPTLQQLVAPQVTSLDAIGRDPCDADRISSGPNPDIRRANCLALFEANPTYGVAPDGGNAGASAEERLAGFQDPAENFQQARVTTGGNPDLRNEVSDTFTYGIVLQPAFAPGLTFAADRVEVDLEDGLSPFETRDLAAACFDNEIPPPGVCEAFTRLAEPEGNLPGGSIVTGTTTTFNAGVVKYRGEVYYLNYRFDVDSLFDGAGGEVEL